MRELFSRIAPKYDLLNSLLSFSVDRQWRRQAVSPLTSPQFARVLDLCAGTLSMSLELCRKNDTVQIDAVDFSEEMLNEGKKRIPFRCQNQIRPFCGDGLALPFKDRSFDGAMCAYGMRNIDDNPKALAELYRVIKPGGRLVILEFFRPDRWVSRLFHATYGHTLIPIIGRLVSRHKNAYKYLHDSVKEFYTSTEYRGLLHTQGFIKVDITLQSGGVSTLITAERAS